MGRALLPIVLLAGCGYVAAGTWDDDPANWERAFGSEKPEGVVVERSRYWRSAHWTYEAGWYFQIAADPGFLDELRRRNALAPVAADRGDLFDPPGWFAPDAVERYEVLGFDGDPESTFRVLIDRTDGTIFLTAHQL